MKPHFPLLLPDLAAPICAIGEQAGPGQEVDYWPVLWGTQEIEKWYLLG